MASAASVDILIERVSRGDKQAVMALPSLAGTADEICTVTRIFRAEPEDVHLGAGATEDNVKSMSGAGQLASYQVVHFATHALLASESRTHASNVAEPALVLSPSEPV